MTKIDEIINELKLYITKPKHTCTYNCQVQTWRSCREMLFYDAADELQRLQSVEKEYNSMKRQNEWYDSRLTSLIESHNNLIQIVADRDEGIRWNRARRKLLESQVRQLRAEVERVQVKKFRKAGDSV